MVGAETSGRERSPAVRVARRAGGPAAPAALPEGHGGPDGPVEPGGTRFRALRPFDAPELRRLAGSRSALDERAAAAFDRDDLTHRLVRALARERALPIKELAESFELFARVRRRVRAAHVVDLCAGHGLTGILFALFERRVERVTLLDQRCPPSHARVRAAVARVAPWVAPKLVYRRAKLRDASGVLLEEAARAPGARAALVAVHACGARTDRVIDLALELGGAVAVMPCCYSAAACAAPVALREHLGLELATDVERTYRLERAGFHVRWSSVPDAITPMNRVLTAVRRADA